MEWEYNTVCFRFEHLTPDYMEDKVNEMLDEQGEAGWELVSTSNLGLPIYGDIIEVLFFFKRAR